MRVSAVTPEIQTALIARESEKLPHHHGGMKFLRLYTCIDVTIYISGIQPRVRVTQGVLEDILGDT
jgi:hypothetical protein